MRDAVTGRGMETLSALYSSPFAFCLTISNSRFDKFILGILPLEARQAIWKVLVALVKAMMLHGRHQVTCLSLKSPDNMVLV